MQRPNYWPRSSYNPRDGSWVQSWYGTPYVEGKEVRSSGTYDKNFFLNNHMQRAEKEYYSSSEVQIIAEKRSSFTNPVSPTHHHSPLSESVSPNSSFSESSFRIASPRNHFISVPQSPQSHCIDVSSPASYQSDEASPRLSHSSPPRSQKYYDSAAPQNLYSDYKSPSRTLPSSRANSHTAQFYRDVHPNEAVQTAEPVNHTQSYMTSPRNDRTFNSSSSFKRYETSGSGWPAYRNNRQSFPRKKNSFTRPNHISYTDKSRPHKPRSGDTDRPKEDKSVVSPSKTGNASSSTASVTGDKNAAISKSGATAPPVEKSITNLISKLFSQDTPSSSVSSISTQEKNTKSSGSSVASASEVKPKSKAVVPATVSLSSRHRDLSSAKMGIRSQQNSGTVPQNKIGVRFKNSHFRETASSSGKLPFDKIDNVKRNSVVLKSPVRSPQSQNSGSVPHLQSNSSSESESFREKESMCKVNASQNSVTSDVALPVQKLTEDEGKRKEEAITLKNLRARISIGSRNKASPKENSSISSPDTPENLSSSTSENLNETFNAHILCKSAQDSVQNSKSAPSKPLKAKKSGWENRSRTARASDDKLLCNGDVGMQEDDFEPKARKSFRPQLQSSVPSLVISEQIESDTKSITSKKKKRRHFRGGRYDMSLKPKKKKEKKSNEKKKSEDGMGGDSSETSEMAEDIFFIDNSNSGDNSRISDTSESLPREIGDNDINHVKSFTDINDILKMPLNDFLRSKLDKSQNVAAEDNVETCENTIKLQNHSSSRNTNMAKSAKQPSDSPKTALEKVCGVARKTQVSYRQQQARISNVSLNCPVKPRCETNVNASKSNIQEQNNFALDFSSIMRGKPDSLNQDSDIEIVGFVERKSADDTLKKKPADQAGTTPKRSNSFLDGNLASLAGFSSDSDDEVLIKKVKRGSSVENVCASDGSTNAENTVSFLSNEAAGSFCTKDSKLPKSLCTCLAKSLCDANTQFPEEMLICQAVDTIDGELVCCKNNLGKSNLVRPSLKIPYIAMCDSHLARLRQHQCCPNCGFFCTQGVFLQCITVDPKTKEHHFHFLHHTCQASVANGGPVTCPHCGNYSEFKTAILKRSAPASSELSSALPDDKMPEHEINGEQHEGDKSDSSSGDLDMSDDVLIPGTKRRYIPDDLQLKAMSDHLTSEKSINLRPSGKSFYAPVKSGDVDKVLQLLAMGVDPNHKFEHHNNDTPLHVASEAGFPLLVHSLVQAGASIDLVNNNLYTPIMLAVEKKHISVVQYLLMAHAQLNVKSEEGMTCLHLAACGGNIFLCKLILENAGHKINVQDEGGWTPLVWAAEHKNYGIAKLLLDRGADANIVDKEKNIALHWAAFSGCVEIAQTLLDWGCSVNAVNEHGDTPLHIAAREDNYECVVLLLARGASTAMKNYGAQQTPLMCCKNAATPSWMALSVHNELQKWKDGNIKCERVVSTDISRGKEDDPIQVVNGVDDEPAPSDFYYVLESCETTDIHVDTNVTYLQSCRCEDNCATAECCCSVMSFQCWYGENGRLIPQFFITEPPLLFECNKLCLCQKSCRNRVVQFGIKCRLQIFRTPGKGWGVRTLKNIPKGSFICEYVGEVITDLDADHRDDDSYLFDLDSRDSDTYCLDARYYGNVSRFINHLCDANLVPVKIFVDHHDLKFPRIAFFSSRDIKAFEELGFDYGDKFWRIKSKWFHCECGSPLCRYSSRGMTENSETEVMELGSKPSSPS